MGKKVLFWVLAVMISLSIMIYQRMTGPTYEKDYKITYQGETHQFALPRSHGGETDCPVEISLPEAFTGQILFRRFPTEESWDTLNLKRSGSNLVTALPNQPPAGKLEYHLELQTNGEKIHLGDTENIVIRFKGSVPGWAQIPHVLLMILTVIWSTSIIFFALANSPVYKKYIGITIILLLLGGFIFGPIVQYYAFGQFWTGWPFGQDLTDNKVLVALVAFLVAWFLRHKPYGRWLAISASLVMLAVYLIPHSLRGSELDPDTGEIITGTILLFLVNFKLIKSKN
ncbi:MAG TPA: hypothetical protein ENN61_02200 [Bacteroidaceae bacterium]|nr:hypothetical protein [Bacteroidaceae bacterium]